MLPLRTKTFPLLPPPTKTFLPLRLLLSLPPPHFPPAFALPSFRARSGQLRRPAALSYSHLLQPPTPDGRCIRIPMPDGLGDSVVCAWRLHAAALQLAASEREHGSDPGSPAWHPRARHRSSRPRQLAPRRPRWPHARRRPDAPARANPPVAVRWAHGSRRSRWKLRFSAPTLSLLFSQRIFRDSEREAICLATIWLKESKNGSRSCLRSCTKRPLPIAWIHDLSVFLSPRLC